MTARRRMVAGVWAAVGWVWLVAARGEAAGISPVTSARDFDVSAFTQWVDGAESPAGEKDGPRGAFWTREGAPSDGGRGVYFGDGKAPGLRHLRVGWNAPVAVGAVLVRGGGRLSALRPDAAYPGAMGDEAQWIPAERVRDRAVSREEVGGEDFAVWVFPPRTLTRALRFTHDAPPTDRSYAGWLGGACVLADRVVNVAPQAIVHAAANDGEARLITNETNDHLWKAWDNGKAGGAERVSPEHPEWVTLIWPRAVELRGLAALWAGFSAADAQAFVGDATADPLDAPESAWKTIGHFDRVENQYPRALGVNWMDLDQPAASRAVRLRITRATAEGHPHLRGKTNDGKRVWLGELMALRPLGDAALGTAIMPSPAGERGHPPIAVRFSLAEPGLVTLVVEDAAGVRVRNLVSETPFPAGENVAWWDGLDDLGRDTEAARHGIYSTPGQFVPPGEYRVRGLAHRPIDLRYEFSVYNAGIPAWETADTSGGWLTNHTPPMAAAFVPAEKLSSLKLPAGASAGKGLVFLGSYVSEGGAGLAWVGLDGRKMGGRGWVGGNWTGAPYLARDAGEAADPDAYLYVAAAWGVDAEAKKPGQRAEIRVTALTAKGDRAVIRHVFDPPVNSKVPGDQKWTSQIAGLAARDGTIVVAMPGLGQLFVVDARSGAVRGTIPIEDPRGLAFDADGRLLILAGGQLRRGSLQVSAGRASLADWSVVIADGLEDPRHVVTDRRGRLYVTDRGSSHQVKVFSPEGKFLSAIGHPGAPKAGAYDPLRMQNPAGLAIDADDHLWVTEADFQPKRVSVWTLDGQLLKAMYGPSEYGGGGTLDPAEKTRFYLHGMEFKLDWENGTDELARVFYRPDPAGGALPDGHAVGGFPETPLYLNGRRYFTNCHHNNPTGGAAIAVLWMDRDGVAVPVAAMGRAYDWSLLKTEPFKSKGVDLTGDPNKNPVFFAWSDINGDGKVQPEEVQFRKAASGGIVVLPDLSFTASRLDEKAVRFAPVNVTEAGVPVYPPPDAGQILADGAQRPASSGGDQALVSQDGWAVLTVAPEPFPRESIGGARDGKALWSYPDVWPGLHASHESAAPDRPGELVGTTRLLGSFVTPRGSDAGPLWAINGNQGNIYLFTSDGLFVSQLFQDIRQGRPWSMPSARRNMLLNDVSLHDENFWPSMTQTADGNVYLVDGGRSSLVRVDGLGSIHRLPDAPLRVTAEDLKAARSYFGDREAARQKSDYQRTMKVAITAKAPKVDGSLEDWAGADWVTIDKRGVAAYFNSNTRPYDVTAAVRVSGDRLYAAFRTGDPKLLSNSGETPNALFKTGGALDLMIGASASAPEGRAAAVEGDQRLLVTLVNGKKRALLYRPFVPGTKEPVPFAAPGHAIGIDRVDDVSDQIQLAGVEGNYEVSVPLAVLGLRPSPDQVIRGDIGILRGNGAQTLQRVYWNNKATAIVSDVPSEAELSPRLWGRWRFVASE